MHVGCLVGAKDLIMSGHVREGVGSEGMHPSKLSRSILRLRLRKGVLRSKESLVYFTCTSSEGGILRPRMPSLVPRLWMTLFERPSSRAMHVSWLCGSEGSHNERACAKGEWASEGLHPSKLDQFILRLRASKGIFRSKESPVYFTCTSSEGGILRPGMPSLGPRLWMTLSKNAYFVSRVTTIHDQQSSHNS